MAMLNNQRVRDSVHFPQRFTTIEKHRVTSASWDPPPGALAHAPCSPSSSPGALDPGNTELARAARQHVEWEWSKTLGSSKLSISMHLYPPTPADSRGSASEKSWSKDKKQERRRHGISRRKKQKQERRGPQAGRQLRHLLRPGERAVCEFWRLEDRGRGPQAGSVPQGPAVLVRRRRRLWGLAAGRQLRQLVFLQVQKSNVRHWGPLPAGPVRPSGPCCFAVARAPFVSLRGWKTDSSES